MTWLEKTFELSSLSQRNHSMEGIRAFAVLLVFITHYLYIYEAWIPKNSVSSIIAGAFINIGHSGVDLFFVLSGYLIYGTLIQKKRKLLPYFKRRIERIYPTFLVILVIYLLLSFLFPAQSKLPDSLFAKIIYIIQNMLLLPGLFDIKPIVTVAWTLSYEFFYYLLIPIIIALFSLRERPIYFRIVLFSATVVTFFSVYYFDDSYHAHLGGPIRLMMFVSGVLLYEVIQKKQYLFRVNGLLITLLAFVLLLIIQNQYTDNYFLRYIVLFVAFFLLCWDTFSHYGLANKIFSFKYIRYLGNMSYSYYLMHSLAMQFILLLMKKLHFFNSGSEMMIWLMLPIVFILTLMPSILLFIFIEKPLSLKK